MPRLRGELELLEHILHKINQRERLPVELDASFLQACQLEQFLREPADLLALVERDVQGSGTRSASDRRSDLSRSVSR